MAAKSRWLLQIPNIIGQLSLLDTPVVDRAVCETLFAVQRRRAIALMQQFGGYQAGNTILIDRVALVAHLQRMLNQPEIEEERQRKQRLSEHLVKLEKHQRAAAVRIPISPETAHCTVADLPASVCFEPGKITVEYQGVEELLACLCWRSRPANDFDRFAQTAAQGYRNEASGSSFLRLTVTGATATQASGSPWRCLWPAAVRS